MENDKSQLKSFWKTEGWDHCQFPVASCYIQGNNLSHKCNGKKIFPTTKRELLAVASQHGFAEIFVLRLCSSRCHLRPYVCAQGFDAPWRSSSGWLGAGAWEREKTVWIWLEQAEKISNSLRKKDETARNRDTLAWLWLLDNIGQCLRVLRYLSSLLFYRFFCVLLFPGLAVEDIVEVRRFWYKYHLVTTALVAKTIPRSLAPRMSTFPSRSFLLKCSFSKTPHSSTHVAPIHRCGLRVILCEPRNTVRTCASASYSARGQGVGWSCYISFAALTATGIQGISKL